MGRPLNIKPSTGVVARTGQKIALTSCWIPGEGSANSTSIILKQTGTNTYKAMNTATSNTGTITLAATASAAGKGVINVVSNSGSGTAVAKMGLSAGAIVSGGTGYTVGDKLTIVGGTNTIVAKYAVSSVSSGVITGVTVDTAGSYTVLPSAPVSVSGGTGTGATFTPTWTVVGANVVAGGTYGSAPSVYFSSGAAAATSTLTSGAVSSFTISTGGAYTSIPEMFLGTGTTTATKITDTGIYGADGVIYHYMKDRTLPSSNFVILPMVS